jgi:hypothetical protein
LKEKALALLELVARDPANPPPYERLVGDGCLFAAHQHHPTGLPGGQGRKASEGTAHVDALRMTRPEALSSSATGYLI